MELGLAGRTAIVCGASSGMGLAIAETLAAEGANVAMFARRREILEREAERIGALAVQGDLTIPQHLSSSVREPLANLALSNAVRPGVVGWLKTLAREVGADGITVNTIAPGRIDTDRLRSLYGDGGPPAADLEHVPVRRLGTPAEIAAVAAFLASDRAGYVTGAVIPVDGGLTRGLL